MNSRINFYWFIAALVVLDSVLLRSPNLLGKMGLIIYNYHYLRTFPKTLVTVLVVVGIASSLTEIIRVLVKNQIIKRVTGKIILLMFIITSVVMLVKTGLDFSTWSYSHTGIRFRLGAYLLPAILLVVFAQAWLTLPKALSPIQSTDLKEEDKSAL